MPTDSLHDRLQSTLGTAYSLTRELGGGGMSRVFLARDAALERDVVVKVLAPELAGGLSAERFAREVKLAARLQQANIVPVLSAGALDGLPYYTMPFVEGQSLRVRLERDGALPVGEVVGVVRDVARALAYAHQHGVVHRDVKPENVLLSHGGAVVADFGIAKAISAARAAGDGDVRRSATLTAAGTSLGTPAYMAPEQAAGDAVDHRADLYALGVIAYELLAGRAPFEGRTAQQLLAAHATEAPEPVARRRPAVPPALAALVMRLLEKNPADRPQAAEDVLRALDALAEAPSAASEANAPRGRRLRAAAVGLALIAAAAAGAALGPRMMPPRAPPLQAVISTLSAPAGQELRPESGAALSPDGRRLAVVAADARGGTAVWVRPLDSLGATRVEGSDGAVSPFWSPDGTSLGFFAGGQLRVADLRGGAPRVLCRALRPTGGAWTPRGVIVFAANDRDGELHQVPAAGGPCAQIARLPAGTGFTRVARPFALPGDHRVLVGAARGDVVVTLAVDVATGAVREVAPGSDGQFAAPHWLVSREQGGGALYAQRLDLRTLRPMGERRAVLDRVLAFRSFASFTVGARALVAPQVDGGPRSLVWVDRQSRVVDSVSTPPDFRAAFGSVTAGVSRDGRRVAFAASGVPMWLHDRERNVGTRTQLAPGILDPAWGPGDSLVAYRTISGVPSLRLYHVGTGMSDSLFASDAGRRAVRTPDWAPDGRRIAFELSTGGGVAKDEIWVYSLAERRAARAWEGAGNLGAPRWSPDGRWMAYVSDETGAPEVFLRSLSGAGVGARVSTAGGEFPRWRADGRELYYRAPGGAIMTVGVRLGAAAALALPRVAVASPPFSRIARAFDVTPDGERFVAFGREDPPVFTLLLDWAARLAPP